MNKVLFIADGFQDNYIDLHFYDEKAPYNLNRSLEIAKEHFESGMLAVNQSGVELDFIVVGLFQINNHNIPCKFTKISFKESKPENASIVG